MISIFLLLLHRRFFLNFTELLRRLLFSLLVIEQNFLPPEMCHGFTSLFVDVTKAVIDGKFFVAACMLR